MIYDQLAPGLQRWLEYKDWRSWTPIQSLAMPRILAGEGGLIIAPTASGKTEAALLPIISRIAADGLEPVALIYVSPLKALINDQTRRAQTVLEENGLRVAWWHGDLSAAARKRILREPPHAIFTTPESLEVILSSDGYGHGALLGNARFALIDEIHAFASNDRGAQLMSLLMRLEEGMRTPLVRLGLSATVSSPENIVAWMRSPRADAAAIPVLIDPSDHARKIGVGCLALPEGAGSADAATERRSEQKIAAVVRKHVEGKRAIVFVNSRADAERLTYSLNELGVEAMVHHGSIAKEQRNFVEERFRVEGPKVIVATSTLELGIDIGDLELVLQIGAPSSASSLLQRMGRSGRREGIPSVCIVYAKTLRELPQTLAAAELAFEGKVEPLRPFNCSLQVLFHQILQSLRQKERATSEELRKTLLGAGSFNAIEPSVYQDVLAEMLEMGYLESDRDWYRPGSLAERDFGALNYRDFYAVFETETEWTVRTGEHIIGTLSRTFPVPQGRETFLLLAGRAWRVVSADVQRLTLLVEPASHINVPKWQSSGPDVSFEVMQRAYELSCGHRGELENEALTEKLQATRDVASAAGWAVGSVVVGLEKSGVSVTTYFGSQLNAYLGTLLIGATGDTRIEPLADIIHVHDLSVERVMAELQRLLEDANRRTEALENALPLLSQVRVGRFWQNLGPKTQRHLLRRFFQSAEPMFANVDHFKVVRSQAIADV